MASGDGAATRPRLTQCCSAVPAKDVATAAGVRGDYATLTRKALRANAEGREHRVYSVLDARAGDDRRRAWVAAEFPTTAFDSLAVAALAPQALSPAALQHRQRATRLSAGFQAKVHEQLTEERERLGARLQSLAVACEAMVEAHSPRKDAAAADAAAAASVGREKRLSGASGASTSMGGKGSSSPAAVAESSRTAAAAAASSASPSFSTPRRPATPPTAARPLPAAPPTLAQPQLQQPARQSQPQPQSQTSGVTSYMQDLMAGAAADTAGADAAAGAAAAPLGSASRGSAIHTPLQEYQRVRRQLFSSPATATRPPASATAAAVPATTTAAIGSVALIPDPQRPHVSATSLRRHTAGVTSTPTPPAPRTPTAYRPSPSSAAAAAAAAAAEALAEAARAAAAGSSVAAGAAISALRTLVGVPPPPAAPGPYLRRLAAPDWQDPTDLLQPHGSLNKFAEARAGTGPLMRELQVAMRPQLESAGSHLGHRERLRAGIADLNSELHANWRAMLESGAV